MMGVQDRGGEGLMWGGGVMGVQDRGGEGLMGGVGGGDGGTGQRKGTGQISSTLTESGGQATAPLTGRMNLVNTSRSPSENITVA